MAKSYVGAPPGELAPPPRGNPGSATVPYSHLTRSRTRISFSSYDASRIECVVEHVMLCHCNDDLQNVRSLESATLFIKQSTLGCSSVVTLYAGMLTL